LVEPAAILTEKGIIGRFLDKGMTKFEIGTGAVGAAMDQSARFKLAEGRGKLLTKPGQPANLRRRELSSKDRGKAKQMACLTRQPVDPCHQQSA
jgi:hypothetical protein